MTKARLMRQVIIGILILGVLFIVNTQKSEAATASDTQISVQDLKMKIDVYLDAYIQENKFSGSILIARGEDIILNKGYGMANYELEVANTPLTKFQIGSVTKQFTAMCIMQLQEKGLLDVKQPIEIYVPGYPRGNEITIHHLLTHSSGIVNYTEDPEFQKVMCLPAETEEMIEKFKEKPLIFNPGEKYSYSNSNYFLLGVIIEKVTGQSYADYLEENILQPLNMTDTGYGNNKVILKNRAEGYFLNLGELNNAPVLHPSTAYAAGALYSTVEDLYKWDQALYTEILLSEKSREQMFTPFKGDYAYGWRLGELFGHRTICHGGALPGFLSYIARYPDDQVTVIICSNNYNTPIERINEDLAAIVFDEEYQMPYANCLEVNPDIYSRYVGKYIYNSRFTLEIISNNNKLFSRILGDENSYQLYPAAEDEFVLEFSDIKLKFVCNQSGKVTHLIECQNNEEHIFEKSEI